jgi:hypothetical protein
MSYYEAARKVRMQEVEKIQMPKEKLYESPWIPGESTRAGNFAVNLSYYAVARKVKEQKEILYDSHGVSWARVRASDTKAWIQQLKFFDRWLFLVTDEFGRNYMDCSNDEDCYRLIEKTFPQTMIFGNRNRGAIEVSPFAATISI